jgi:hypothetical protein
MFVQSSKQSERVKAGIVAVVPGRLKRVPADKTEAAKLKAVRAVADAEALDLAEDIGFAAARRAGAGAPELFQADVAFLAIAPDQRQFVADDFGAERMEAHFSTGLTKFRQEEHEG